MAGGHVLPPPIESVYSGVVSLQTIHLICYIIARELNGLDLVGTDISNAYLKIAMQATLLSLWQDQNLVISKVTQEWW